MLELLRLTKALGAEVVTPFEQLLESDGSILHAALMEHQVLFIEGQNIAPQQLAELGRQLGPVTNTHHAYPSHPDAPEVAVLEWGGDNAPDAAEWHADMTYRTTPPFASVLRAIVVPPAGGDTLWASMYSVYESLSKGLRSELADLEAVHDMGTFRTSAYRYGGVGGIEQAMSHAGTAVHPVVAHHPVTGRPYVNVSESFTRFIIGMSAPEASRLLTLVFDAIKSPEHQVRRRWKPGSVAIWDNRGTQHYALADYLPHRRVMHRVAVSSDARAASSTTPCLQANAATR